METTAEGAETLDELELIRSLGCSHIQGYIYGLPTTNDLIMARFAEGDPYARASGFKASREARRRREADASVREVPTNHPFLLGPIQ